MVSLKKMFKKVISCSVIMLQLMTFMPTQTVFAAQDDIPKTSFHSLFSFVDENDLKAKIIQDPDFIDDLAYLAHYMGFGWCGGTGSPYVGDDFDFEYVPADGLNGNEVYKLKAHYDANDPYADGYWADKRLEIELSNVSLYIDGNTLEFGESKITDIKPLKTIDSKVKNWSNIEDSKRVEFSVGTTDSWSRSDNYSFSQKIGIKNKYKFDIGIMGNETEISFEFSANQGWSDVKGGSTTQTQKVMYDATIPPLSQRTLQVVAMKKESELPYTANMYIQYDLTFKGFLRTADNARNDHPTDRPFVEVKFGGKNNLSAAEDILDQYIHRDISGYSEWDWDWMLNQYYDVKVRDVLKGICKKKYGGVLTGKFTGVGGTYFDIDAGPIVALEKSDIFNRSTRSLNDIVINSFSGDMTVEDVTIHDVPGMELVGINFIEEPILIPQEQMTATATSAETVRDSNEAACAIDNDPSTIWHTDWDETSLPQSITLNLDDTYKVSELKYLPRQDEWIDGGENGRITGYNIYVSEDGVNFTKVSSGTWADNYDEKTVKFTPISASYIKLEAVQASGGFASAAEINVYGE